jgi:hypothetical protein
LSADITVSARIKTADTGARVEMNSAGIKVYDAGGLVVDLSSSGTATFKGSISSGSTITGATFQTAASGASRLVIGTPGGGPYTYMNFYGSNTSYTAPVTITQTNKTLAGSGGDGTGPGLEIAGPVTGFYLPSTIELWPEKIVLSAYPKNATANPDCTVILTSSTTAPDIALSSSTVTVSGVVTADSGMKSSRMRLATQGFDSAAATTTSTTFATPGTVVETTFIAPPSGVVMVVIGGQLVNGAAGNQLFLGFEVRNTNVSGSVVLAASDNNALQSKDVNDFMASMIIPVSGLTAGNTYYVRLLNRVTAGTGTMTRRRLNVIPLL